MENSLSSSSEIWEPAAVVQLGSEPRPRLTVGQPLPGPLSFGRVVIPYRTENLRIIAVYGAEALKVSPRVGHLHITVDDLSWHWLDASGEPLTFNGFTPGEHSVLVELADPTHKIIGRQKIFFTIPDLSKTEGK